MIKLNIETKEGLFFVNEKKVRFYIEAKGKLSLVKIDGELFDSTTHKKCDYLIFNDNMLRFIELKGSNISDAIKQIVKTIEIFKNDDKLNEFLKNRLIIGCIVHKAGKCPKMGSQEYRNMCKDIHKMSYVRIRLWDHLEFHKVGRNSQKNPLIIT